jgi:hemerythrin-like domain-containing protein
MRGVNVSTDAIVILKDDHARVKKLFREFEQTGHNAKQTRNRIVTRILEELTVHTCLENEVMYPEVRRLVPDLQEDVLESFEQHHVADVLCLELSTMDADDERFVPKTMVLIESVSHHIDEEEHDWFPKVREALGRRQLQEIGARMEELRATAPGKPYQPSALKKAIDAIVK